MAERFPLLFLLASHLLVSVMSRSFTIENKCEYTIWPASYSYVGSLDTTGFRLETNETRTVNATSSWIGNLWGRTDCDTNSTGYFSCVTGDCGSGEIECSDPLVQVQLVPPATLAEFNLAYDGGDDYYDVNVINGYNLPMLVTPENRKCKSIRCVVDINNTCPSELRMNSSDIRSNDPFACMTSCQKNQLPELCCVGLYVKDEDVVGPEKCKRTIYSQTFNRACPGAYSYAYDTNLSTFTCPYSNNFVITFCPPKPGKSTLKLKLILGASSVFAMIIIIAIIVVKVRENNMRKSDRNRKDMETVGEIMSVFADQITEEEDEELVKKMAIVGLWCIQTNPFDRPPMSKVVEMLEGSQEALQIPPKPILSLPARTVQETSSFSIPSQDTFHYSEEVQDIAQENQDSISSS
ncbi:unnamed protein product [Thlaspi arvense]|uniref:Uncharacterized protein n=1 Tax=Thlaspi arvense TaxID=13288 RepID=A0AAU9S4K1_THLAR|nr:unnamed protein product [Thlaspi arvense]